MLNEKTPFKDAKHFFLEKNIQAAKESLCIALSIDQTRATLATKLLNVYRRRKLISASVYLNILLDESNLTSPVSDLDDSLGQFIVQEAMNRHDCRVSVIIPTWNRESTVVEAISSALRQTLDPFEIIICDDGSTDNTKNLILKKFGSYIDQEKIVLLSSNHDGVSAARNHGLRKAKGNIIAYLDSDNTWLPHHLLINCYALTRSNDYQCSYSAVIIQDEDNSVQKRQFFRYDRLRLLKQNFIDLNSFIHRRTLNTEDMLFDERLKRLVDYDLIIRLTTSKNTISVPVETVMYRLNKKELANISLVEPLRENADIIHLKYQLEYLKSGILSKDQISRKAASYPVVLPVNMTPPRFMHQSIQSEIMVAPNSVLECRPETSAKLDPKYSADTIRPYMGRIELFIILADNHTLNHALPVDLVQPRYIKWVNRSLWTELDAFGETIQIHSKLPEGNYWFPDLFQELPKAHQLATLAIATEHTNIDMAIGSCSLENLPVITADCIRNMTVIRNTIVEDYITGNILEARFIGKVLRIPILQTAVLESKTLDSIFGGKVDLDPKSQYFGVNCKNLLPTIRHLNSQFPLHFRQRNAVVLAVAQKLNVGGVERNTIEVSKQLKGSVECIYLTLEKIYSSQGSLCYQAIEACLHVIDLAEIAHHAIYPDMLARINHIYKPNVVWICNGSMWINQHYDIVRQIFDSSGIVDQQVYDTDVGWIQHYVKPSLKPFDRCIAVTQKIMNKFIGDLKIDPSIIDFVYSAIDADKFETARGRSIDILQGRRDFGLPDGKIIFVFMGRLVPQKNPQLFLDIAKLALNDVNKYFVMVGNGELSSDIIIKKQELGLSNFSYIENIRDTSEFWPLVDAYVVTSSYEGLPIAMIEAISMGVPVFATDVGDIKYILDKYDAGWIVDSSSAADFYQCLTTCAQDLPEKRQNLKEKSSSILNFFSAKSISSLYLEVFRKAMLARPCGA